MQATATRPVTTRAGSRRRSAARSPDGPRPARGRRNSLRSRPGTWQGGLGVCIIVASAAIGAIGTMLSRSEPGFLLQLCVVAGTVSAALAIRPNAGRMIIPVPVLSYVAAALLSGIVFNRSVASSRTALALAAAQWIANGFFAMMLATVLAVGIVTGRWYLWHRRRPGPDDQDWRPPMTRGGSGPPQGARPAAPSPPKPAQSPPAGPARADRRPTEVWSDPGPRGTGPRPGSAPQIPQRPTGPTGPQTWRTQGSPRRAGSEPYNFSSGA